MNNALQSESFVDDDHLKQWLADFFASKPAQFYKNGIHSLPDRWKKVVDSDGDYIVQ
jgi:hypothetical protein